MNEQLRGCGGLRDMSPMSGSRSGGEGGQVSDDAAPHSHRWRYEEPDGPVSVGRCIDCGAEREGDNVFVDDREPSWGQRYRRNAVRDLGKRRGGNIT